jgi:hypothetical protein
MREKLNSNPMAQLAVIGVLLVVGALMMMRMMGGGSSASEASTAPVPAPPAPASGTTTATAAPAAPTAAPAATGAAVPTSAPVVSDPPPLPDDVVAAHQSGATVVVLLVHPSAPEDNRLERTVRGLAQPGVAVFVAPAEQIARFASITQSINVDRVPALIVIEPKGVSAGQPEAIVRYGFRNPESVVQAVKDAVYKGATRTYSPE